MKLLLTSAGLSNQSIKNALKKLVNNEPIKIAFIPTAANGEQGDKKWLEEDFKNCKSIGTLEIVDIEKLSKKDWLPKLKTANVIFVGGGDTSYLMNWVWESKLAQELPSLLKTRIYVGISAGSLILSKTIQTSSEYLFKLYDDEVKNAPLGLNYIEFDIRPHLNSPYFPKVNEKNLEKIFKNYNADVYAIDDETAILVNGDKIEVVSEGKWIKYPKS